MIALFCPKCKSQLNPAGHDLSCPACKRTWSKKCGIISFIDDSYSYGSITKDQWEEIFQDISDKSNEEIQSYFLAHKMKGRWPYIQSFRTNKADGTFYLPVTAKDKVLDIGCGPGSLSVPLAKRAGEVYAVDATLARLRFLELRAKNEGVSNIRTFHASALAMPFQGSSFDHVLMNGVFEYMGEWDQSRPPEVVQKGVLKNIHGLLKPEGHLFMAIENRYGFDFIYRKRDHSKLYLTSLMPRHLADLVTLALRRRPYRTYTYSYRGYLDLFAKEGFKDITIYYAWPSYQDPRFIIPSRNRKAFTYFLENFLRSSDRTMYLFYTAAFGLGMEGHFFSHFIITAKKGLERGADAP
ncbi:MAG: Demethylmenaquinone methyltransferase [Syntrophus sp. PtaU1.Bin005]|mgnify:CR=1 FL=1|jgi:2-polyprenyl-3-methyl-5-hydroxy-6-metoxy-1,4-benzoquinol methylase|nr:MAG: Demethylmenaquinone methyltransferase [Syntrophus sp. PtaU1.Bin005]